jgi:molecular chaperone DnaK
MYKAGADAAGGEAPGAAPGASAAGGASGERVVDADFEDIDDKKKSA